MLESTSRCLLLAASLAALCALAPLAGAGVLGQAEPVLEDVRQQAGDALPHTGTPIDGVAQDLLGSGEQGQDPASGDEDEAAGDEEPADEGQATGSDPQGEPEPSPLGQVVPTQTVRDGVALAGLAVTTVLGLLPEDPVDFLGQQVQPIQDAAEDVLVPDLRETEDPAPASATITAVEGPSVSPQMLAAGAGAAAAAALVAFWLAGSSGSVSAGATAASGAAGGSQLRRLLPFASPLFTRFEKDTVLGHPKRETLYALILQDPGVSLQSLCDATGLSRTAVTHHLRLLELQHLIVSKRMGRSRHYFENGGRFGRDQKEAYAVLHNDRSKDVARYVRDHPGAIQKALCESLGIQPSIAHWHLRRLQQAQLVEAVRSGRTVAYFPAPGLKALDQPAIPVEAAALPELAPPVQVPMLRALPA